MTMLLDPKMSTKEFKFFKELIYELSGIALADSKQIMVQGRLAKRLRTLNIESFTEYSQLLAARTNQEEITHFINALTTNKTDFFREPHHFQFLTDRVFPEIEKQAKETGKKRLRIWCSASSTGEEPYTIAMTVREHFGEDPTWDIRILASDIDTDVLDTASKGIYPADGVADVPKWMLTKYFDRESRSEVAPYRAKSTLRDLLTFRRINLQEAQWPINCAFDVIFCRNVMIYFDHISQRKIVNHFAEHMLPNSYLIIGHSESLFGISEQFQPLGETVYRLRGHEVSSSESIALPTNTATHSAERPRDPSGRSTSTTHATVSPTPKNTGQRPRLVQRKTSEPRPQDSHPIIVGEVFATAEPIWITTLLGSCVATCLYDDIARVGGMNHFMLPESNVRMDQCASYGVHSMEMLINSLMKLGAKRSRLQSKVFGGGRIIRSGQSSNQIGARNADFALRFLETECIPLVASFTGGDSGMHVKFHTHTQRVIVRLLDSAISQKVERDQELRGSADIRATLAQQDVTLF